MKIEFELIAPSMPNFIRFKKSPITGEDGLKSNDIIPIKNLTEDQAKEYAELMKQSFINHWKSSQNRT